MKFKLSILIWALVMATAVAMWVSNKPSAAQPAASAPTTTKTAATAKVPDHPYPFATSVVSGQKLDGPGTGVTFEQDGYEVKLASQAEADTFKKDPAPYLAKITDAYKNAKACPLTVCPVMGDPLDKDAYAFVYEGRQFKFCCDACLEDFQKDPDKFVKIWDTAEQNTVADKK